MPICTIIFEVKHKGHMATSITILGWGELVTGEKTGHYCDQLSPSALNQTRDRDYKAADRNILAIME